MSLVFQTFSQKYLNQILFLTLEAEKISKISGLLEISVVPTFIGIKNGIVFWKLEGANPPELGKLIKKFIENSNDFVPLSQLSITQPSLEDLLHSLVSSSPVMLFMKGSPINPRCGFSRKTVEILKKNNIQFNSFDILQDDEVRNGLKKLFDWPTYPQLYVNGELIGGYDILLEMSSTTKEEDGGIALKKELGIKDFSTELNDNNNTTTTSDLTTTPPPPPPSSSNSTSNSSEDLTHASNNINENVIPPTS